MSLLEERIRRSSKNRPTPGTTAPKAAQPPNAVQTSPDAKSGVPLRNARPVSAYYSSDNKNFRSDGGEDQRSAAARPISGVFAAELEQTVQKATGLRGQNNSSIHIDLVPVNFDDILNEPVPLPRYK